MDDLLTVDMDVSRLDDIHRLEAAVHDRFGGTDILMNNAGIQSGSSIFGSADNWQRVLGVNLWGVINGTQVFVPGMIMRDRLGLVINTGSKQGITTHPAYNVSKAGVKAFTEALQQMTCLGSLTSDASFGLRATSSRIVPLSRAGIQTMRVVRGVRPKNLEGSFGTERGGFEPPLGCPKTDFESAAFNHSATSPADAANFIVLSRAKIFHKLKLFRQNRIAFPQILLQLVEIAAPPV